METCGPEIVVVEDDIEIRSMVLGLLRKEAWACKGVGSGDELDDLIASGLPDIVLLDINLPGEDGLSIARRLAALPNPPAILMLTARGDDIDRIVGLEIGADDYLAKPFHPRELIARIRAITRRLRRPLVENDRVVYRVGGFTIDLSARQVTRDGGGQVSLSGAEFALLTTLVEAKGRVLSRDFLLDHIHGREATPFDRSIDVLVSRLRRKIDPSEGPTIIESVRNAGYVLRTRA